MHYYAKIVKQEGVYRVFFPDLPNVLTYGETLKDAKKYAHEALNGVLEVDFERGFSIPPPTEYRGRVHYYLIPVEPHIAVAYMLRQLRKQQTQGQLAKRLGISYQAYQRLENPRKCNPTIKTLEKIGDAMGKNVRVMID